MKEPFKSPADELWEAWASGRMALQRCGKCGRTQHPPGGICAECGATDLSITPISGVGRLLSWSTVTRAPTPELSDQLPYTIGVAATDEGALFEARLSPEVNIDSLVVGAAVRLELGTVSGRRMPFIYWS